MSGTHILAIDQGTSSSRAVVFDAALEPVATRQQEFRQLYPRPGWVEHDAGEIWDTVVEVARGALAEAGVDAGSVAAIGITNQRETTVVWDRETGEPVCNAIVWQDRRTARQCAALREAGLDDLVAETTGLRLDPYFSATKLAWILEHIDGARARADRGELAFGTIDTYLIWRLTGGAVHATDATNASRTMLFDIHRQAWSDELLDRFGIPRSMLPDVHDCISDFGEATEELFGGPLPIRGVAGDQQAALIGQAGFADGMTKSTYGTGCFVIANTGSEALRSSNQLLTTVATRIDGKVVYGLEGSVFVAGSAIQWLRDAVGIIETAAETEAIARETGIVEDVYVVPAFAGLGAPYWDPDARGAILGLTRGSDRKRIVTATLQAIAFQTCDLMTAMAEDGISPSVIRVDGGMAANEWFLQFLADLLGVPVERPVNTESTVLGAAGLAAVGGGIFSAIDDLGARWTCDRAFEPSMADAEREQLLDGWAAAVGRVRTDDDN